MFFVVFFPPSWGRVGLVNGLQRGFCTENEAGQSGATEPGMCGMSSGSSRAISITQPAIKATRAQSPGNWLKATQTRGFLPRCRSRFPTDVCGLPKEPRQTAFAPSSNPVTLVGGGLVCLPNAMTTWGHEQRTCSATTAWVSVTHVSCAESVSWLVAGPLWLKQGLWKTGCPPLHSCPRSNEIVVKSTTLQLRSPDVRIRSTKLHT